MDVCVTYWSIYLVLLVYGKMFKISTFIDHYLCIYWYYMTDYITLLTIYILYWSTLSVLS